MSSHVKRKRANGSELLSTEVWKNIGEAAHDKRPPLAAIMNGNSHHLRSKATSHQERMRCAAHGTGKRLRVLEILCGRALTLVKKEVRKVGAQRYLLLRQAEGRRNLAQ